MCPRSLVSASVAGHTDLVHAADSAATAVAPGKGRGFSADLMYAAATLYYLEDVTQAEVAAQLKVSRATVSRLLSEARRQGIVRIEVVSPAGPADTDLAARTADALGLRAVHLAGSAAGSGATLSPALSAALVRVGLQPGEILLVSTGRTVYEAVRAELPQLPGVLLAPTIGGQDESEPWYQSNEIIREAAARVGGRPTFLYAPALPGRKLYRSLLGDPSTRRVLALWENARCVVLGVGGAPLTRASIPGFVPTDAVSLREAVGDVCSRFYDRDGRPVAFPGNDRLMAIGLEVLQRVPVGIAVAFGAEKVGGIVAGARAGYFNELVTDTSTAELLSRATPP